MTKEVLVFIDSIKIIAKLVKKWFKNEKRTQMSNANNRNDRKHFETLIKFVDKAVLVNQQCEFESGNSELAISNLYIKKIAGNF